MGVHGFRIGSTGAAAPVAATSPRDFVNCFASLTSVLGVRLISLQKGPGQQEISEHRRSRPFWTSSINSTKKMVRSWTPQLS